MEAVSSGESQATLQALRCKVLQEHMLQLAQSVQDEQVLIHCITVLESYMVTGEFTVTASPSEWCDSRISSTTTELTMPLTFTPIASSLEWVEADAVGSFTTDSRVASLQQESSSSSPKGTAKTSRPSATDPSRMFGAVPMQACSYSTLSHLEQARDWRRTAISAAPVTNFEDFQPKEVEKTKEEEAIVREGVESCQLFSHMSPTQKDQIVRCLAPIEYSAGQAIITEGGLPTQKFFLITKGTCEVNRGGKLVATLVKGRFFGELELMHNTSSNNATIRCVSPCTLYYLDQETYQKMVLKTSLKQREKFEALVSQVPFFGFLSQYDHLVIAEALITTSYVKDEVLIKFGSKGLWLHIILEGEVVVLGRRDGKKVERVRLGPGSVVGELEFLFDHLTVADVVAFSEKVVTARINRRHLEGIIGPIQDQLRDYVSSHPIYGPYMAEATDAVRRTVDTAHRRVVRERPQHSQASRTSTKHNENLSESGTSLTPADSVEKEGGAATEAEATGEWAEELPEDILANESGDGPESAKASYALSKNATAPSFSHARPALAKKENSTSYRKRVAYIQHTNAQQLLGVDGGIDPTSINTRGEIFVPYPLLKNVQPTMIQKSGNGGTTAGKARRGGPSQEAQSIYRFPLYPLEQDNLLLIGLREDGIILHWNEAMARLASYPADEVLGQSMYSFLAGDTDHERLHAHVRRALKFTGNPDEYFQEEAIKHGEGEVQHAPYTLMRSDGLTKVALELRVIPPSVGQVGGVPDMVLVMGREIKRQIHGPHDYSGWLVSQLREQLTPPEPLEHSTAFQKKKDEIEEEDANRLVNIRVLLDQYIALTRSEDRTHLDEFRVVDITQMIGQLVMDFGALCVSKGISVQQKFSRLDSEEIYCDVDALPQCLRSVMNYVVSSLQDIDIELEVFVESAFGTEYLQISIHIGSVQAFPEDMIDAINGQNDDNYLGNELRLTVERQGGLIQCEQLEDATRMQFSIPYIPSGETEVPATIPATLASDRAAALDTPSSPLNQLTTPIGGTWANNSTGTGTMTAGGTVGGTIPKTVLHKLKNYTSLVVEDSPQHRNMLCSYLWERKHATLPAYSLEDLERLYVAVDIMFIDPEQSILSDSSNSSLNPLAMLREAAGQVAVVITGTHFEASTLEAYHKAGFLTLAKPFTALHCLQVLRKAEEKADVMKYEASLIEQRRALLAKDKSRGAWEKGKQLGKGSYGEVWEAIDLLTGGKMAVKIIRTDRNTLDDAAQEIQVMCNLQHPNIIHYFYCDVDREKNTLNVFMEYADGGTLTDLIRKEGKPLPFERIQELLQDIVQGIAYIHDQHYVHCDIKTANILLKSDGRAKIGDFGTAYRLQNAEEEIFEMRGTPLYMSPECMSAGDELEDTAGLIGYSFPTDIWSIGCIFLEMVTNQPPFQHVGLKGSTALMHYITTLTDTPDLSPLFELPPSAVEFAAACLNPDPKRRPTAEELLQFNIFNAENQSMNSALKALQRAQLLHALNKFVAFQDPPPKPKSNSAGLSNTRSFIAPRNDAGFFSSDDDSRSGGACSSTSPHPHGESQQLHPHPHHPNNHNTGNPLSHHPRQESPKALDKDGSDFFSSSSDASDSERQLSPRPTNATIPSQPHGANVGTETKRDSAAVLAAFEQSIEMRKPFSLMGTSWMVTPETEETGGVGEAEGSLQQQYSPAGVQVSVTSGMPPFTFPSSIAQIAVPSVAAPAEPPAPQHTYVPHSIKPIRVSVGEDPSLAVSPSLPFVPHRTGSLRISTGRPGHQRVNPLANQPNTAGSTSMSNALPVDSISSDWNRNVHESTPFIKPSGQGALRKVGRIRRDLFVVREAPASTSTNANNKPNSPSATTKRVELSGVEAKLAASIGRQRDVELSPPSRMETAILRKLQTAGHLSALSRSNLSSCKSIQNDDTIANHLRVSLQTAVSSLTTPGTFTPRSGNRASEGQQTYPTLPMEESLSHDTTTRQVASETALFPSPPRPCTSAASDPERATVLEMLQSISNQLRRLNHNIESTENLLRGCRKQAMSNPRLVAPSSLDTTVVNTDATELHLGQVFSDMQLIKQMLSVLQVANILEEK